MVQLHTSILNIKFYALSPGNVHDKILYNINLPPVRPLTQLIIENDSPGKMVVYTGCLELSVLLLTERSIIINKNYKGKPS